ENVFNIIGAFDIPRYIYNSERKKFLPLSMTDLPGPSLFGTARDKAELFRERYSILQQRTHRHELFTPSPVVAHPDDSKSKFQLKTVETLLGNTAKVGEVIVLGMITQLKEGKYFLEDPTGVVQLDLSKAISFCWLFCCSKPFLGWYEDEVFHVNAFGFPPTEPAATTRAFYGNINFFGGPSSSSVKASAKLKQLEEENEDAMFVFVSDVWLDQAEVLEKLRIMFSGGLCLLPRAEWKCERVTGLKTTQNSGWETAPHQKGTGHKLAESCRSYKTSSGSGSELADPGGKLGLSQECRIQYCTQEIIIFREDLVNKMCRNCVRFPSSNMDIPNHFVKTILSQGHLTPLPLYVSPVFWAYDYSLRVYPVPDVLVTADKHDPFTVTNTECLCINPGSFPRSGFSFKVFYPSNKTVED
ncbi:DPOE2 polymerase, partial [Pomatorhinus ruficollis]|nr:DPOE2 polymerase [Pomatorhinus ruficollis]